MSTATRSAAGVHDNADVDRLFGLVDASDEDASASSFASALSSSSSSTSSNTVDPPHTTPTTANNADALDEHLEQTKSYHRKRRREETVDTASAQAYGSRPNPFGARAVLLSTATKQLHPLFATKPHRPITTTASQRTLSTSALPLPPPTSTPATSAPTSTVSSSHRLLSDQQLDALLTPTPYYSRQGVQDFDQIMSGSSSQVSAYSDLTAVAEQSTADYIQVPSFALGDGGVHGPHTSDHSVHKSRHDGYWEERLRKLEAQQPREQYYYNLPAFTATTNSATDTYSLSTTNIATPPSASASAPPAYPPIFAGCSFYIDGRTEGASHLSAQSLTALIRLHGGRTSPLLSRTHTTHILATNLTLSKHVKELRQTAGMGRGRGSVIVVKPEWVRECIRCGRWLDEWPWRVVKDSMQRELSWSMASGDD